MVSLYVNKKHHAIGWHVSFVNNISKIGMFLTVNILWIIVICKQVNNIIMSKVFLYLSG